MYQLTKLKDSNISKSIRELYQLTQFNQNQYPGYLNWYYIKNIPRIEIQDYYSSEIEFN